LSKIRDIIAQKGTAVVTIGPDARAIDAALLMNEHKIGALPVVEFGELIGIISERDMMRRVVAARLSPDDVPVRAVMTRPVVTCRPDTRIEESREIFRNRRIRHLPVVDEHGRIGGMISIGDLNAWQLNGQEAEIQHLHEYLYGGAA